MNIHDKEGLNLLYGAATAVTLAFSYAFMQLNDKVIQPWFKSQPWFSNKSGTAESV